MQYSSKTSGDPTVTQIASQYKGVFRKLQMGKNLSPECKTAIEFMENAAQEDEEDGGNPKTAKPRKVPTCTGTKKMCAYMMQFIDHGHEHCTWDSECMPTTCKSVILKKAFKDMMDAGKKK